MTEQQENTIFEYLDKFPDSLTRRAINFDDDEFIARIAPLMKKALADGQPLTDAIFNFDKRADY